MSRQVLKPSEKHPITIGSLDADYVVTYENHIIARAAHAILLKEASYPERVYVPRDEVNMTMLRRSETTSYCPYKGEASYYDIVDGDKVSKDAIWTYETPHPAMSEIKDYMAFYPDRVSKIEQTAFGC